MSDRDEQEKTGAFPKEDGYNVPDGYFESLTYRVMEQVSREDTAPGKRVLLTNRRLLAVAAAVAAFIITLTALWPQRESGYLAGIEPEEAYQYVYNNIDYYDISDLYEVAGGQFLSEEDSELSNEDVNIAIDALLDEMDPEELNEIF